MKKAGLQMRTLISLKEKSLKELMRCCRKDDEKNKNTEVCIIDYAKGEADDRRPRIFRIHKSD